MDSERPIRLFTIQEANETIPWLKVCLYKLQDYRHQIFELEVEIDALELISEKPQEKYSPEISKKTNDYQELVKDFYQLVDDINKTGCVLKDVEQGLVDFYAHHHGRTVFLCWKMGEDQIDSWHEIDSGFASRQPLDQD